MNSSVPRAEESLAEAAQSIVSTSSPGWYGRELATSDPVPRRTLCTAPKARPISRRRGTSGKVRSVASLTGDLHDLAAESGLRPRSQLEALLDEARRRLLAPVLADLDQERGREEDPVSDHGQEQLLDVLGNHVVALLQQRPRPCRPLEGEAAADGSADRDGVELARGAHEVDHPPLEQFVHIDVLARVVQHLDVFERDHRPELAERVAVPLVADDLQFLILLGIAERGLEEEAVELCLRERERPFQLDRVLRREDEEGMEQLTRDAVDRHLRLGHRLEQRGLRLRHRAVDLVHEDDVGEDRPRPELEVPLPLVVDRQAGDVGGLQVRRALDPRRGRTVDALRDRPCKHRLRRARHVLQEHMAAAGEGGENEADLVLLAADDVLDVRKQPVRHVDRAGELFIVPLPLGLEAAHGRLNIGSAFIDVALSGPINQTLNRMFRTSPSATTYPFPSSRCTPRRAASAREPASTRSFQATTSQRMNPRAMSV